MSMRVMSRGPHRPFEIVGGLRVGYEVDAPLALIQTVIIAHHKWQEEHHIVQEICVTPVTISYGSRAPDGSGAITGNAEPGFIVAGLINPLYQRTLTDEDGWVRLYSLAEMLASVLQQKRMYVSFAGETHILETVGDVS